MIDILCDSCIHNSGGRCGLYDIPILHDTRFCDAYKDLEEVKKMKILDSFIVDDGKNQTKIELIQIQLKYLLPKRYVYALVRNQSLRDFLSPFFFKFFAKRRFNKLKKGYESCWLQYGVYEVGAQPNRR